MKWGGRCRQKEIAEGVASWRTVRLRNAGDLGTGMEGGACAFLRALDLRLRAWGSKLQQGLLPAPSPHRATLNDLRVRKYCTRKKLSDTC